MKTKTLLFVLLITLAIPIRSWSCTNLIVGKKASTDGSVFISYSCDGYGFPGSLKYTPPANYFAGEMYKLINWDATKVSLEIPQPTHTYGVIGDINELQVAINETTFDGRPELRDTLGRGIHYWTLMQLALQRAKTAREAIHIMGDLVNKYGYQCTGESFSVADPNEAWIMEMIGKGSDEKGAVWVAVRIPDDCIAAHANQSRIHQFSKYSSTDCMYSKDVISFARKKGYFSGKDKDFDFANAYNPISFGGRRFCEARVWSFYQRYSTSMKKYISYIEGKDNNPMPLYIKPDRKLSLRDVEHMMRDHYEGTPLDPTQDISAGPFHSPYRMSALTTEVDGKKMFNERFIGTPQAAFTLVSQLRSNMPNCVGGIMWYGLDDSSFTVFTPVYCCTNKVPESYTKEHATRDHFSWDSAFWVYNWVAGMVRPYYSLMIDDVLEVQNRLEDEYATHQDSIEQKALALYEKDPSQAKRFLTNYTQETAQKAFTSWKKLGEKLLFKYNDGTKRNKKTGRLEKVAYPKAYNRAIIKATGSRYIEPTVDK